MLHRYADSRLTSPNLYPDNDGRRRRFFCEPWKLWRDNAGGISCDFS
jgi:hypothetical protein